MKQYETGRAADLKLIDDLVMHYRGFHALTAAVTLGMFDALSRGPATAQALADRVGAAPRAVQVLLEALAALGLVEVCDGLFRNAPLADQHFRTDSPASLASNFRYQQLLTEAWSRLPQVVQTGQPAVSLPDLLHDHPEFADCYIHGMADISRRAARELAATIDLEPVRDVLDVGGGGGVYAEALAERSPSLNIVLLDLAPTLKIAAERLAHSPHRHRIQLREGDYHHADFGAGAFDLVLFSHVMHDEGEDENKSLLNKALLSLRRGGTVVIHDFMAPGPGPGPLFPALFSLHMLVYTQKGRAYRADEYQTWLREGGWVKPRRVAICTDRPTATTAILAGKP